MSRRDFTIDQWLDACHSASVKAGWWDRQVDPFGNGIILSQDHELYATKIALIHSEVSEMLEGLRKGKQDEHLPFRTQEEAEAADIGIRLFDYCKARGLDLAGAMADKMDYNAERADHKPEARNSAEGKKF